DVLERPAAAQRERAPELAVGRHQVTASGLVTPPPYGVVEDGQVELVALQRKQIPRPLRPQGGDPRQGTSQLRDVRLQAGDRGRGRPVPHTGYQLVSGDRGVEVEEQRAENRAELSAEPYRPVVTVDLDRAENQQTWPGDLVHRRRSSVTGRWPETMTPRDRS